MSDRGDTADTTWHTLWAASAVFTYESTVAFLMSREDEAVAAFEHLNATNQRMASKFGGIRQRELLLALNGLTERFLVVLQSKGEEPRVRISMVQAWYQQGRVIATWLADEARSRQLDTNNDDGNALHFENILELYLNNVMSVIVDATSGDTAASMHHLVDMLNASCSLASAFSLVDIPMSDSIRGMINRIRR